MAPPKFQAPVKAALLIDEMITPEPYLNPLTLGTVALEHAFNALRQLSTYLEAAIDHPSLSIDPWDFDDRVVSTMYVFLSITGLTTGLQRACRLAAIIYLRLLGRPLLLKGQFGIIVDRLWAEVSKLPQTTHSPKSPTRSVSSSKKEHLAPLTWILVIGSIASRDSPLGPKFMGCLCDLSIRENIAGWHSAKTLLEQVAWVEKISGGWAESVWGKLQEV
ncbi:MAG: hypothetical protein MMC23_006652 [Stictis urceolatum]|nr:hypothetical protein [Stictis urceolata]